MNSGRSSAATAGELITEDHSSDAGWEREGVTENSTRHTVFSWPPLSGTELGSGTRALVITVLHVYTAFKEQCVVLNTFKHLQNQALLFDMLQRSQICLFKEI